MFSQFLINHYLSYINERFKNYKNTSKSYYINDILKTFMSQMVILKISFKKKIHDEYLNKEELLDEMINNNLNENSDKNNIISDDNIKHFFNELFISVIDLIITDSDNIYLSLIYKTKLLELSLY